jgi:hypothetical protein
MTDRIRTLRVILDRDMRDDDVEVVTGAIRMIRCVAAVENGAAMTLDDYLQRTIALQEFVMLQQRFLSLFGRFAGAEAEDKRKRIQEILGTAP